MLAPTQSSINVSPGIDSVVDEARQPWSQMDGENDLNFDHFTRYRLMGARRSVHAAYHDELKEHDAALKEEGKPVPVRAAGGTPGSWRDASIKWRWRDRVLAWDRYLRSEDEAVWFERRKDIRTTGFELAQAMIKKGQEMMKFPLATVTRSVNEATGTVVTEVKPAKWDFGTVTQLFEAADKLARIAAEMQGGNEAQNSTTINIANVTTIRVRDVAAADAAAAETIDVTVTNKLLESGRQADGTIAYRTDIVAKDEDAE